jgi:hypothetical protein
MMKIPTILFNGILALAMLLITIRQVKSQDIASKKAIEKIREQYALIKNNDIPGLRTDVIDMSYVPSEEEMQEAPSANIDKYEIYYTETDTFLIRKIHMMDEGGAYFSSTTEVYFWNNQPFFYYFESSRMWEGIAEEDRIYIEKGSVIRKLHKEAVFYSGETGYTGVSMEQVPNVTMKIYPDDLKMVIDFIRNSKWEIQSFLNSGNK